MNKNDFFDKVYDVVRQIPEGKVTSYGAIANYLGVKKSARLVGWAMNASHGDNSIPAHRVVNRVGLENEGILIKENKILNLELYFWDPQNELPVL